MTENQIPFDSLRVLLIEASDNDALIIEGILRRAALKLQIARSQSQAEMELALDTHGFDIILCGHDIPEFTTREVLEVRDERKLDLPLIVVTGTIGGEDVANEFVRGGVADFVSKHDLTGLLPRIKRSIGEARSRQAKRNSDAALQRKNIELETALASLGHPQAEFGRAEKMKGLGRMVAGITHDLNNALSRIVGLVEQIQECGSTEDSNTINGCGLIREAVDEAITTIRSLSYFSDIRPCDAKAEPVDINEAIAESLDLYASQLDPSSRLYSSQLQISTNLEALPMVNGDATHFRDAITSLIIHAHESMPTGGDLRINTQHITSGVVVEIEHRGHDKSEEVLDHAFKPCYGTGLAPWEARLAWVYALMEWHGVAMSVKPLNGEGTKVILRFSIKIADSTNTKTRLDSEAEAKSLKIMVVDDDTLITQSLAACLKVDHHFVKTASNGFEALELLRDEPFDLMISDRAMRELNGEELAKMVRDRGAGVKFILATGSGDRLIASRSAPEGVDVILPKPITRDALRRAISESGVFLSA